MVQEAVRAYRTAASHDAPGCFQLEMSWIQRIVQSPDASGRPLLHAPWRAVGTVKLGRLFLSFRVDKLCGWKEGRKGRRKLIGVDVVEFL